MPRENVQAKARRLVSEGRVTIRRIGEDLIVAHVRGDTNRKATIPRAIDRPSAQQHVEQDDYDRNAECQESDDHRCAARRGRRVCFHHPQRARIGARTDRIVERNVGISQAAVSAHHGPSRAVVLFQDRDPSEPREPTSADVGQVGTRDTGRTATADAHTRKVREVQGGRLRCGVQFSPSRSPDSTHSTSRKILD
jgi:hypothetical protein